MRRIAPSLAIIAILAACGGGPATTATSIVEPTVTSTTPEEPTLTRPPSSTDWIDYALAARDDLATALGVAPSAVKVTSVEAVTWNDGSIGCPEPGMAYTQALVDGYRITLVSEGTEYHYHQGGGEVFACEDPAEGSYLLRRDESGQLDRLPPPGLDE